jgi:hypothetical protein
MRQKLRNITITLEENLARWARVEAAKADVSLSSFLAALLEARMKTDSDYEAAMDSFLSTKPFLKTDGRYLTRGEAHERTDLR